MNHLIGLKQTRDIKKRYSEDGKKVRGCRGLLGTVVSLISLFYHTKT